jgi:hypothetical protein
VEIADRTFRYFDGVHREVFADDPATNPALTVEVVEPSQIAGCPTLVLITPWTLNGMVFGDLEDFPPALTVGAREYPVFANTLPDLGPYRSVNLIPDVSTFDDQEGARKAARAYVQPFRDAVTKALDEIQVEDRARRELLRGLIRPDLEDPAR